jgi:hypothetical protein
MSIIDYQQETLSPEIWDLSTLLLKKDVENFLLSKVDDFFNQLLSVPKPYIKGVVVKDILIASSLASYFYTKYSDFDIKIIYSLEQLLTYVPELVNTKDISSFLTELGRNRILNVEVPRTHHRLDPFFISQDDSKNLNYRKFDSLYSVFKQQWLKPPKHISYEDMLKVVEIAKEKAQPFLDKIAKDIEEVRKESIDFMILYDYLKTLQPHQLKQFKSYIEEQLSDIDVALQKVVTDANILKLLRRKTFEKSEFQTEFEKLMSSFNFSDENLLYKFATRYGYLRILVTIKQLLERG